MTKPSKLEELSKAVAEILGDFAQEVEQFGKTPELFGYAPRVSEPLDKIMPLITHAEEQAELRGRSGWKLELPDLPYFQIKAFDKSRFNKEWVSPIYDTKNLPAELDRINGGKDE